MIFLLRISLGILMFYAGITKLMNPNWSAAGYLRSAKTFGSFYQSLTGPAVIPVVNFINEWGLTLLGISLILGIGVRLSSLLGSAMLLLYYLPILHFPYVGDRSYIVDEHIIYILVLWLFYFSRAGQIWWGLESWFASLLFGRRNPKLRQWLEG